MTSAFPSFLSLSTPPSFSPFIPSLPLTHLPPLLPSPIYSFLHPVVVECLLCARCLSSAWDTVVIGTDFVPALVEHMI